MDEDETSTSFFDKISSFSIVLFFVISYLTYYFLFVVKVSERAPIGFLSQIFTWYRSATLSLYTDTGPALSVDLAI